MAALPPIIPPPPVVSPMYWHYFIAPGGGFSTGTITELIGKQINELTRDGIHYRQVYTTAFGKRFYFNSALSEIFFDTTGASLEPDEPINIKYSNAGSPAGILSTSQVNACMPVDATDVVAMPDATVGIDYNYFLTFGGSLPMILSAEVGAAWMTFALRGPVIHIWGTPQSGDEITGLTISATITNCDGDFSFNDSIDVEAAAAPPACTPVAVVGTPVLPDATVGTAYNYAILLSGDLPIVLSLPVKPAWMTMALSGHQVNLTGTPAIGDVNTGVTISFTVSNCSIDTDSFSDTIDVGSVPPVCTAVSIPGSPTLPDATVGTAYSYSITLAGDTPIVLSLIVKPSWMAVALSGGNIVRFTGTPLSTNVGTGIIVSFRATNCSGANVVNYSDAINVSASSPVSNTIFGALIGTTQSIDDKITICQSMGLSHIRGGEGAVAAYRGQGNGFYNKCKQRGMKLMLNLNWNQKSAPTNLFASNETLYKNQFERMLSDYADDASVIPFVVIENEPTNRNYYGDLMANYIRQLGWAIDVCHAHTPYVKVADGCTHIAYILQVKNGGAGNGVAEIITGINNLRLSGKVLDYINMHNNSKTTGPGDFARAAQYLRDRTGIQKVISNEWHIEPAIDTEANAIADGIDEVRQSREANLIYSVAYGGDYPVVTGKAYPFSNGLVLTNVGKAIRDEIASVY